MSTIAVGAPVPQAAPNIDRSRAARARRGRASLRRAQQARSYLLWGLVALVLMAMTVGVLHTQAQVTQLSGQIEKTQKELTDAKSTYDYLSGKMSDITSSTNVQQIAENRLGLVRADASQITYIKLQEESLVERAGSGAASFLDGLGAAALSLIGSLDP